MNGRQRVLAAMRGEPHDRVPVVPIVGQAAATWCGVPIGVHARDPEVLARCQIGCAQRMGYDAVYISADTWVNAEACGFPNVEHSPDEPACGRGGWIESVEQLDALPLPDPARSGRWPIMVEAVRRAVALAEGQIAVIANFDQAPFDLACQFRGINQFMLDLVDDPPFAHRLLDWCVEPVARYAIAMARAGAAVLNTGDSAAGGSLIGPGFYEEFAWPYEQRLFQAIRHEVDTPATLHICGDASTCLERMACTGAAGLELDYQVDLAWARKVCNGQVTIIGNVNPVDPLLRGTPDAVRAACRACLEANTGSDRFILASGCTIAPSTPPQNIAAMIESVKR